MRSHAHKRGRETAAARSHYRTHICALYYSPIYANKMLVFFEGLDATHKSSLSKIIFENLTKEGYKVCLFQFPNRQGPIGELIDRYLKKEIDFNIHAIHLLFAADQLNSLSQIEILDKENFILLFDRSFISNITFYQARGGDPAYIQTVSKYFPRPDLIFYCSLQDKDTLARRCIIERFETASLQERASAAFDSLKEANWIEISVNPLTEVKRIENIIKSFAQDKHIQPRE